LPLDPLTPAERKFAEQIAREDSKVRELLGNRPQLISIALLFLKPEGEQVAVPTKPVAIDRHAEVLFRREDEAGVRAVVNLSKRSLVAAERITSMEVPLTPEDISQAAKLALRMPSSARLSETRSKVIPPRQNPRAHGRSSLRSQDYASSARAKTILAPGIAVCN